MLVELKIENFGIIENLKFKPGKGLNIITGETGSGKSLIIQALSIVLGERAGTGYVRNGSNKASVEAVFDISRRESIKSEFEWKFRKYNIPLNDDFITLKREIYFDGKPRAMINNVSVSLSILKEIGSKLVEIHGQHENQRLLDPSYHLDYVDLFGGLEILREKVSELYHEWIESKKKIKSVSLQENEKKYRKEFLEFSIKEIEELNPIEGEYEKLINERSIILNSGKLFEDLSYCYSVLQEEDHSVLSILQNVEKILEKHSSIINEFDNSLDLLKESVYNIETLVEVIREKKNSMNFSEERLEDIEERIEGYKRLFKKYGSTTTSVLQKKEEFKKELSTIEMSDEEKELLVSKLNILELELKEAAEELSNQRKKIISVLEEKISKGLEELGMKGAKIVISLSRELQTKEDLLLEEETTYKGESFKLSEKGFDQIEFLFCANEGEILLPLRKIASGGELSRIALILKSILMDKRDPLCIVFDEVDTGIGGETAYILGKKLKDISIDEQIIAITHLHQVASLANRHFKISKITKNSRTYAQIERLMGDNRLKELARMLGGSEPIVIQHAKEILNRAQEISEGV
ncbi:MAG: DNA repair protein RecN [Leptonema sp. (in: bacteria)]